MITRLPACLSTLCLARHRDLPTHQSTVALTRPASQDQPKSLENGQFALADGPDLLSGSLHPADWLSGRLQHDLSDAVAA